MRVSILIGMLAITACTRPEAIAFDPNNDAHCVLAFLQTKEAARKVGKPDLEMGMASRADWARNVAKVKKLQLLPGQELGLREYLESGAREGSKSTIACRHRQNADPRFPRNAVPYA